MTDKEAVLALEPRALATRLEDDTWIVCRSPVGVILGCGLKQARAWHEARMRLFAESIGNIISEIPAVNRP
jgi:hypothetical protein